MKRSIEVTLAVTALIVGIGAIAFVRPSANAGTPQKMDAAAPNPYDAMRVMLPLFSHPPVSGSVTSEFGAPRRRQYENATHLGVDFDAKIGGPVISLAGGMAFNTVHNGYTCVRVKHEALPGIRFIDYCHINSVVPNGTVRAGQVIGTVAKPSSAQANERLHLQMTDSKGQAIDPCQPSIMICPKPTKR